MKPAIYRRNSWLPTNGWFPSVFDEFLNNDMLNTASNVAPSVNVKETANREEDKHEHYLRREFAYTNFEQKYTLPDNVDEAKIAAKVEDGILTIELPKIKREEGKTGRQIAIS